MNKRFSELSPEERKEYYREKSLARYYSDLEAAKIRAANYRKANKDYIREKQKQDKRNRKLKAIQYLGGKCFKCDGQFHPAIYEFHHTDPSTKEKDPSKLLDHSWKRVTEELNKCILVCANCHRLIHHKDNYEE